MATARSSAISRRRFVGGMAVAAATCAVQASPAAAFAARGAVKVGVLLPSSMRPAQVTRFLHGLRAGFDVCAAATRLGFVPVVETYPVGLDRAVAPARSLLTNRDVLALIAVADASSGASLVALGDECGKRVLLAEAGGNVAAEGLEGDERCNSLGYWQGAWALGEWAAGEVGRRAYICASHLESGYDALYAFQAGFEAAGGTVSGTSVTHVGPGEDGVAEAVEAVRAAAPDVVYAAYGGSAAVSFVRACASAGIPAARLLASGFTVDEAVLPRLGGAAIGIRSCLPWSPTIATAGNAALAKAYARYSRATPDALAALAYDTAIAFSRGVTAHGAAVRLPFARGDATAIPGAVLADVPLYLREVRRVGGALRNVVVGRLGTTAGADLRAGVVRPEVRTGWLEPYMGG